MNSGLNGMLPIAKPRGMISKDVSRHLGKILGRGVKMGHVGTLDPMASGVLPILLGPATRLQDYLLDLPKTYRFTARFGSETDTLDSDGVVLQTSDARPDGRDALEHACQKFRGTFAQTPPLYSAKKVNGRPLYDYARSDEAEGLDLTSLQRHVTVFELELLAFDGESAEFSATCSKGTYVRSLARDIAAECGSLATVTAITRTRSAGVDLEHAVDLDRILKEPERCREHVIASRDLDLGLPRFENMPPRFAQKLRNGGRLSFDRGDLLSSLSFAPEALCFAPASSEDKSDWQGGKIALYCSNAVLYGIGEVSSRQNTLEISLKRGI